VLAIVRSGSIPDMGKNFLFLSSPKRPDRLCPTGALSAGAKRFGRDADHAPDLAPSLKMS